MDEAAGELGGDHPVHRLHEAAVERGREHRRGVFLHADDRAGGPELVLGVERAAVIERQPLPTLLEELDEDPPQVHQQFGGRLRLVDQVEDALVVAAQQGVQVGRSELRPVADRVAAVGTLDQRGGELTVLLEPGVLQVEPLAEGLVPGQVQLLADHVVRQHADRTAEIGRNEAGKGHLDRAGPAEHVVVGRLPLAEQGLVVVQPLFRLEHLRRDVVVDVPRLADGEVLQRVPADAREPDQRPVHVVPVPERPVSLDLGRIVAERMIGGHGRCSLGLLCF